MKGDSRHLKRQKRLREILDGSIMRLLIYMKLRLLGIWMKMEILNCWKKKTTESKSAEDGVVWGHEAAGSNPASPTRNEVI